MSPKGSKSKYWLYFGFRVDTEGKTDEKKVECKLCSKSIAYSRNTTNLKQHLEIHHPSEYRSLTGEGSGVTAGGSIATQSTLEAFRPKPKLPSGSKRAREITDALVQFIAKDMRPLSTVEGDGFRQFCCVLDPQYQVPSRKTVTTQLKDLQQRVKLSVQAELDAASAVALTTDFWSSRSVDAYLGVTALYITPLWRLKSCVLQTREVTQHHTSQNISTELDRVANEWSLTSKLAGVTTDNARNIVKGVVDLEWQHVPCFAHTLNLSVKAGLQLASVSEVVKHCRRVVFHFHHSCIAQNELELKQESLGDPKRKLVQDVVTRWNSTFEMIESLLSMERSVAAVLLESKRAVDRDLILQSDELAKLRCIAEVLKPLVIATEMLCVESVPSISMVQPMVTVLRKKHLAPSVLDTVIVTDMKTAIVRCIDEHFSDVDLNHLYSLASYLDPRFKNLKYLPASERSTVYSRVVDAADQVDASSHNDVDPTDVDPSPSPPNCAKLAVHDDFMKYNASSSGSDSPSSTEGKNVAEHEEVLYRSEDQIERKDDPLEWWSRNSHRFPTLARIARRILCLQATSVPAERLFSSAGDIVSQKRASLHPSTVDCLLFLSKNLDNFDA